MRGLERLRRKFHFSGICHTMEQQQTIFDAPSPIHRCLHAREGCEACRGREPETSLAFNLISFRSGSMYITTRSQDFFVRLQQSVIDAALVFFLHWLAAALKSKKPLVGDRTSDAQKLLAGKGWES